MLNSDFKIVAGKRKFVPMTIDEFKEKVRKIFLKDEDYEDYADDIVASLETFDDSLSFLECVIDEDFKYHLLIEDEFIGCFDAPVKNSLLGLHTLSNGFTFFGFTAHDAYGNCMFVITYFDHGKLKTYVPTKGNTVNRDFKCVLGGEDDWIFKSSEMREKAIKIAKNYLKEDRLFAITSKSHEGGHVNLEEVSKVSAIPDDLNDICWNLSYAYKYLKSSPNIPWNDPSKLVKLADMFDPDEFFNSFFSEESFDAMKEEILLHFVPNTK